jgi:hypothetical protein
LAASFCKSSAWKCAVRDEFLGWDAASRERGVNRITTHILTLPWVRVPELCSHVVSGITARIGEDLRRKYAQTLCTVETFVDTSRFCGTCNQAATWTYLGQTSERTRQDRTNQIQVRPRFISMRWDQRFVKN